MAITFTCPSCHATMRLANDALAGKTIKCPRCSQAVKIPLTAAQPSPPSAPPTPVVPPPILHAPSPPELTAQPPVLPHAPLPPHLPSAGDTDRGPRMRVRRSK